MSNLTPTPKVAAGAFAGALTTLIVWGLQQYAGITLPAEVAASLTTILSFAVAWITPNN